MEKEFSSFRKAAFGGFNRKDVINYIEKMRNESFEYRKQVEETVKNLNEKICELENAARLIDSPCSAEAEVLADEASTEYLNDIGPATKHLKTIADELCRSLGDFMDKLTEKGLFDKVQEDICEDEETVAVEEKAVNLVDGILSSISYLDTSSEKNEALTLTEKKKEVTDISDLLSGSFFVK